MFMHMRLHVMQFLREFNNYNMQLGLCLADADFIACHVDKVFDLLQF